MTALLSDSVCFCLDLPEFMDACRALAVPCKVVACVGMLSGSVNVLKLCLTFVRMFKHLSDVCCFCAFVVCLTSLEFSNVRRRLALWADIKLQRSQRQGYVIQHETAVWSSGLQSWRLKGRRAAPPVVLHTFVEKLQELKQGVQQR